MFLERSRRVPCRVNSCFNHKLPSCFLSSHSSVLLYTPVVSKEVYFPLTARCVLGAKHAHHAVKPFSTPSWLHASCKAHTATASVHLLGHRLAAKHAQQALQCTFLVTCCHPCWLSSSKAAASADQRVLVDAPDFWTAAYTLRKSGNAKVACPAFLQPVAHGILSTGKSLILIRAHHSMHQRLASLHDHIYVCSMHLNGHFCMTLMTITAEG